MRGKGAPGGNCAEQEGATWGRQRLGAMGSTVRGGAGEREATASGCSHPARGTALARLPF